MRIYLYYDSSIGRFINEDPVKDGLNWYSYCANNPIRYKDSSGLYFEIKNTNKDSKEVNKESADKIINELEKITDYKYIFDSDTNRISIDYDYIVEDETKVKGNLLVKSLIESEKQTIKFKFGKSSENMENCVEWKDNIPSVSNIFLNFDSEALVPVYVTDALGNNHLKTPDPSIILAHELIHVYRKVNGTYSQSMNEKEAHNADSNFNYDIQRIEEFETAGIQYYTGYEGGYVNHNIPNRFDTITENDIRFENAMCPRAAYTA